MITRQILALRALLRDNRHPDPDGRLALHDVPVELFVPRSIYSRIALTSRSVRSLFKSSVIASSRSTRYSGDWKWTRRGSSRTLILYANSAHTVSAYAQSLHIRVLGIGLGPACLSRRPVRSAPRETSWLPSRSERRRGCAILIPSWRSETVRCR
jgi:hypothetical protein